MSDTEKLIKAGYARVSNAHRHVSRIDRKDWKEHMASTHPGGMDEGMAWVKALGRHASDHYRRCHSKDQLIVGVSSYKKFPASGGGPDEYRPLPKDKTCKT